MTKPGELSAEVPKHNARWAKMQWDYLLANWPFPTYKGKPLPRRRAKRAPLPQEPARW